MPSARSSSFAPRPGLAVDMKQPAHVDEIARVSAVAPLGWDRFKTLFSEA